MAAAPDPKGILVFTFQHNEDGTINVDKSLRSFFNSIHEWSDDLKDIAMPLFRMVAQLNILCAAHRSSHAAHGVGAYVSPSDDELKTWRDGRAAAAGVALVPADAVLKEAFDDFLQAHSLLCTRRRITAAAAKTTHKRSATSSVNSTIQMALLNAIKLEDKLKHLVELEEVVANEGKYGVISAAESDFVLKLSCVALFREISIIIRSEVKAVAGAARRLFTVPDPLHSLASHVVKTQPGFDLIRSLQFSTVVELIDWVDAMSRVNYLMTAARSKELPEAYRTVYEEVFDLLTTEMLVNPAPITLPRLLPMVEILREKLKNRDLDPDNVVMPPPILPPPSTPTSVFRKQRLDEDPVELRRLEAEADVCRAKHHLRSLGGQDLRGGRGGGRGRGQQRSISTDARTGKSGGAGKGRPTVCFSCQGFGHFADVCPNNILNEDGAESHVERTTRLRSMSQKFQDHLTPGLQLDDDGYFYDPVTGK
jgi:hypothetical protein